ncbi:glycosyltransferase family 4 protein [Psychrobacter sp. 2Y5]|uniref:glycosyltransferase family 4 protein n=1 Tax=unclassified Psychrobacter TaxID=196806 RepID=UPI003F4833CC
MKLEKISANPLLKKKTQNQVDKRLKTLKFQLIEKLELPLEDPIWYPTAVKPGQRVSIKAIVEYLNISSANNRKAVLLIRAYDETGNEVDVSLDSMFGSDAFDANFKYIAPTNDVVEELYTFIVPKGISIIHFGFSKFLCSEDERVVLSDLTIFPELEDEIIDSTKKLQTPDNHFVEKIALPLEEPVWYPMAVKSGQSISIKAMVEYLNIAPAIDRKAVLLIRAYDETGEEVNVPLEKMFRSDTFEAQFKYLASTQGAVEELYRFIVPEGITTIHFGFNRFLCSENEQVVLNDLNIDIGNQNIDMDSLSINNQLIDKEYYLEILDSKNVYSMLVEFDKNNSFLSDNDKAYKLIMLSKAVDSEPRLIIAAVAANLNQDAYTLIGYAWACIHSKNYYKVISILDYLQKNKLGNEEQVNSLEKALCSRLSDNSIQKAFEYFSNSMFTESSIEVNNTNVAQKNEYQKLYENRNYDAIANMLFDDFKGRNVEDVIKFINIKLKTKYKFSNNAIVLIMIKTGKKFGEFGSRNSEIKLVESAIDINKSTTSVRAGFWAYYRQGSITKSRDCLNWLEDYAKNNNDKKQLDFVNSKKNLYLFIEKASLLELINNAIENPIENFSPISNNIAYVLHNTLPYASGGYATRGHGLANAIQSTGTKIEVVGRPGFPLDIRKELTSEDVEQSQIIEEVKYEFILAPRRDGTATLEYIVQSSEELVKKLLKIKPSLIIAASNHLTALPALIAARKLGIPFIYEVRGFWEVTRISREPEFESTEFYKVLCDLEALAAMQADYVFTLTTPMAEELVRRGVSKDQITILPNSCDPERFEPVKRDPALAKKLNIPNSVPVIGYIGTFVQYEGLDHLAEACGRLKKRGVEFRLLIVGNENTAGDDKGPITQAITNIAVEYDFEDWLIMPGRIPHEEVESYYSLVDIAPFPRKPQPVTEMVSPMKPLEAAAMKKAIVVSSVRALTDMITDSVNGLVFEKGNIESLSEKLYQLIIDDNLRLKLGENARKWVETDRTWEKTVSKLLEVTSRIVS